MTSKKKKAPRFNASQKSLSVDFAKLIKTSSAKMVRGKLVPLSNERIEQHLGIGTDGSTFRRYLKGERTLSAERIAQLIKYLDRQHSKARVRSTKTKGPARRLSPWVSLGFRVRMVSQGREERLAADEARAADEYFRLQASAEKAQLSYLSKATANLRTVEEALKQLGNFRDETFDLNSAPKKKPVSSRWKGVIELHDAMQDVNAWFSRLVGEGNATTTLHAHAFPKRQR